MGSRWGDRRKKGGGATPDSRLIERSIKKNYEQKNVIGRELGNAATSHKRDNDKTRCGWWIRESLDSEQEIARRDTYTGATLMRSLLALNFPFVMSR